MTRTDKSRFICKLTGVSLLLLFVVGCEPAAKPITEVDQPGLPTAETEPFSDSTRQLSVLAWNIESGGNDPQVIAGQLLEFVDYDVICLNEVSPLNFALYGQTLPPKFSSRLSETGRSDRLAIFWDESRFELLEAKELMEHNGYTLNNGTHRSPLYVRLKERTSDLAFIVMTNHLARANAELRTEQSIGLREWARDQTAPIINIGDFNMDFDFKTEQGNDAFPEILRDNIFNWVRPETLIDTNWADSDGDGLDNYPDSMLDFSFVANAAKDWNPKCRVIVRDGDFPDDETTSDHRPIELVLTP